VLECVDIMSSDTSSYIDRIRPEGVAADGTAP